MHGSGMKTGLDKQSNESQPKWWKRVCLEKEHSYGLKFQWAHRIGVMGGTQAQTHRDEASPVVLHQGLMKPG